MSGDKRTVVFRVASRGLHLASVRYRGLLPACALEDAGWAVRISAGKDELSASDRIVVAIKPLIEKEAAWVENAIRRQFPVVVDLCDNIFVPAYGGQGRTIVDRFRGIAEHAGVVTVPTEALREVVLANVAVAPERVFVVPDIVETRAELARTRHLLGMKETLTEKVRRRLAHWFVVRASSRPVLLWFGNQGASHGSFGITDLLLFADALAHAASQHRAQLWVVSNSVERFREVAAKLPIESRYFAWEPFLVDALLPRASVCLIPNSGDEFSRTKSSNRALKSLAAGVPVVATPTPALEELSDCVWLDEPAAGIEAYLSSPYIVATHVAKAQERIRARYSLSSLRSVMERVVESAQGLRQ